MENWQVKGEYMIDLLKDKSWSRFVSRREETFKTMREQSLDERMEQQQKKIKKKMKKKMKKKEQRKLQRPEEQAEESLQSELLRLLFTFSLPDHLFQQNCRTHSWWQSLFIAIRGVLTNPILKVIMNDLINTVKGTALHVMTQLTPVLKVFYTLAFLAKTFLISLYFWNRSQSSRKPEFLHPKSLSQPEIT